MGRVRAVPRLCELYPDICLTTCFPTQICLRQLASILRLYVHWQFYYQEVISGCRILNRKALPELVAVRGRADTLVFGFTMTKIKAVPDTTAGIQDSGRVWWNILGLTSQDRCWRKRNRRTVFGGPSLYSHCPHRVEIRTHKITLEEQSIFYGDSCSNQILIAGP